MSPGPGQLAGLSPRSGEFILGWVEFDDAVEAGQGLIITLPWLAAFARGLSPAAANLQGVLAMTVLSSDSRC